MIYHGHGISRLIPNIAIKKGNWYYGFVCPECNEKILLFEDKNNGAQKNIALGEGKFSVPCHKCMRDEVIFGTGDLISMQADSDGTPPAKAKRVKPSNRPRQPIGQTKYKDTKPTFGTRFIEDRPESALIIARCVGLWSYVEVELALLLASLLHIDSEPAAAIFLAISNSRTQQQVLTAAASTVLNEQDFELVEALMGVVASIEKERNDLVHGCFGGSMLLEQGLFWASQRDYVGHTVQVWSSQFKNMSDDNLRKRTFVYEPEDLETVAQKIEWLTQMIGFVRGYCGSDNEEFKKARYLELSAEPAIAEVLTRMREKARPANKGGG